jgi:hypothetical protein
MGDKVTTGDCEGISLACAMTTKGPLGKIVEMVTSYGLTTEGSVFAFSACGGEAQSESCPTKYASRGTDTRGNTAVSLAG